MKKVLVVAAAIIGFGAMEAEAFDPYFAMPADEGGVGLTAGLASHDVGEIGDMSDVFLSGKYAIMDGLEAGATATLGFLNEWRDDFSTVVVGAKYQLMPTGAATANLLLPIGDVDDIGLALGMMYTHPLGDIDLNSHLEIQLLDGYVFDGINIGLLLQPVMRLNEQISAYLDVSIFTNTDDIGDWMNIDLRPHVDYRIQDDLWINAGVLINAYKGIDRSSDIGLRLGVVKTMSLGAGY